MINIYHEKINNYILSMIDIDKLYICYSSDNNHPDRKPNPGMILKAKKEYNLDLTKSFVIGGILPPKDGFKGAPRLNDEEDFGLALLLEVLKEPPFLIKLLFGFSITTEFFL